MNHGRWKTTQTATPYQQSGASTGFAELANIPEFVFYHYTMVNGLDSETGIGHRDGTDWIVDKVLTTFIDSSKTYDSIAPAAITKSGETTITLTDPADSRVYARDGQFTGSGTAGHYRFPVGINHWHSAGQTLVVNRETYVSMELIGGEIDALVIEVATANGANCKMKLYDAGPDGSIGEAIAVPSSSIALASGFNDLVLPSTVRMNKGQAHYWMGIIADAGASIWIPSYANQYHNQAGHGTVRPIGYLYDTGSYATGLPDVGPAAGDLTAVQNGQYFCGVRGV